MSMRTLRPGILIACLALLMLGCVSPFSDPLGRKYALEETQRRYTELIRWGEYERAAGFVPSAHRSAFDTSIARFEAFRVTDYDVGRIDFDEDHTRADVTVTYRGYAERTLVERPVVEHQLWTRDGMSNTWLVEPSHSPPTHVR